MLKVETDGIHRMQHLKYMTVFDYWTVTLIASVQAGSDAQIPRFTCQIGWTLPSFQWYN